MKDISTKPLSNINLLYRLMFTMLNNQKIEKPTDNVTSASSSIHNRLVLQPHQFLKAVTKFNNEDKTVFSFLSQCDLMSPTPSAFEVARFLRSSSLLNKKQIGEYLGKNKDFNKEVLIEYVKSFDFHGIGVLDALRMFLESFRLPGESQQIDRIIEVSDYGVFLNRRSQIMHLSNVFIEMIW